MFGKIHMLEVCARIDDLVLIFRLYTTVLKKHSSLSSPILVYKHIEFKRDCNGIMSSVMNVRVDAYLDQMFRF
jgi:hypothetical protein